MDGMPGYNLHTWKKHKIPLWSLTQNEMLEVMIQVIGIVKGMKERGCYHLDIKPANIMVEKVKDQGQKLNVSLVDFDLVKDKDILPLPTKGEVETDLTYCSLSICSPEMMRRISHATNASDIKCDEEIAWELGETLGMVCGDGRELIGPIHDAKKKILCIMNYGAGRDELNLGGITNPKIKELILKIMAPKKSDRLTDLDEIERELEEAKRGGVK